MEAKKSLLTVFVLSLVILGSGCASITRGTTDVLVVKSHPQQAQVKVYRTDKPFLEKEISKNMSTSQSKSILAKYKEGNKNFSGPLVGQTPATFILKRNGNYKVTVAAKGYKTSTVLVKHKTAGKGAAGMAGNVLVGGIIGVGVDAATGATQDLTPNPIIVRLKR